MRLPKLLPLIAFCLTSVCLATETNSQVKASAKISAKNRQTIKAAIHLLDQHHVSQRPFGDELSQRVFDSLFESLDPAKLHFLQSDVEEFRNLANQIDDLAKKGDASPATRIFNRITLRSGESLRIAEKLLEGTLDFSADDSVIVDSDKREYAADQDELRDRWRRELKWKILVEEAKDAEIAKSEEEVVIAPEVGTPSQRVLQEYRRRHRRLTEMNGDKVFEWYLNAIATAYDPHTSYMLPRTSEEFMMHIRSHLQGIGAELREQGDHVYVSRILEGGGAARCEELSVGDRILAVSEDGIKWVSAFQMSVSDLASKIRGKAGTIVRLRVRSKTGVESEAVITRSRVELKREQASGQLVDLAGTDERTEALKVGYVRLPGFYQDGEARRNGNRSYRSCSRDVEKLLVDFRNNQASAVILDLRSNGGGLLDEAIRLVGLFIDKGPVVQVKGGGDGTLIHRDQNAGTTWNGPLVVLTNKYSASASEIVAGALQDYGRAIVIGDPQTHGKGTVQTPMDIANQLFGHQINMPNMRMGTLKLTIQRYYLPDGQSTQRIGVTPGVVIPFSFSKLGRGEAEMENAIRHDQVPLAKHDRYSMTGNDLLSRLTDASQSRMSKSAYFKKIESQVNRVSEQRETGKISVCRDKFKEYWSLLSDDQESGDEPKEEKDTAPFPRNEYDEEVLQIVGDYVQAIEKEKRI